MLTLIALTVFCILKSHEMLQGGFVITSILLCCFMWCMLTDFLLLGYLALEVHKRQRIKEENERKIKSIPN